MSYKIILGYKIPLSEYQNAVGFTLKHLRKMPKFAIAKSQQCDYEYSEGDLMSDWWDDNRSEWINYKFNHAETAFDTGFCGGVVVGICVNVWEGVGGSESVIDSGGLRWMFKKMETLDSLKTHPVFGKVVGNMSPEVWATFQD